MTGYDPGADGAHRDEVPMSHGAGHGRIPLRVVRDGRSESVELPWREATPPKFARRMALARWEPGQEDLGDHSRGPL